jgi:hypothetical protein
MTTLSAEDNTRQGTGDCDPRWPQPCDRGYGEILATPPRTERVEASATPISWAPPGASAHPTPWAAWGKIGYARSSEARWRGYDGTLSDARDQGIFSRLG